MIRPGRYGYAVWAIILIAMLNTASFAEDTLQAKIDSMFVIASSGDFKYRELVEPTIDDIAALGVEAVPYLIDKLGTKDARERVTLENILKKIGPPAIPYLNDALLETDSLQLSRVAKILYYLPDSSSVESLMKVAENRYFWVRYESIRALGKIADRKAAPAIKTALGDSNELVRTMAAVAAGRLGAKGFHFQLVEALSDSYYGVRMAAYEELKKLDCDSKRRYLFPFIQNTKSAITRKLLLSIMAESFCACDIEIVRPFFSDTDPVTRSLALKAAYRCAPDSVIDYLSRVSGESESLILRQTIEEIKNTYGTETTVNP